MQTAAPVSSPAPTAPEITVATPGVELFDIQSRPGAEGCTMAAEVSYNEGVYGWNMYNTFGSDRDTLIDFSSGSRNLRFGDGVGEVPPEVVDESSMLRHGYGWTPRGRVQLAPRIYQGPADLSSANMDIPPTTMGGDVTVGRHSALAGVSIDRFDPEPPDVQDPAHIVPTAWVRGGQDTRAQTRTLSYIGSSGFAQAGAGGDRGSVVWVAPGTAPHM
jgi:hypothetical protein